MGLDELAGHRENSDERKPTGRKEVNSLPVTLTLEEHI